MQRTPPSSNQSSRRSSVGASTKTPPASGSWGNQFIECMRSQGTLAEKFENLRRKIIAGGSITAVMNKLHEDLANTGHEPDLVTFQQYCSRAEIPDNSGL